VYDLGELIPPDGTVELINDFIASYTNGYDLRSAGCLAAQRPEAGGWRPVDRGRGQAVLGVLGAIERTSRSRC
jgi:hypothetical protein